VSHNGTPSRRRKRRHRQVDEAAASDDRYSRWAPVPANSPLIDGAIGFWQPMSSQQLTREDAREIIENMTGFFSVLLEWEAEARKLKQRQSEPPALDAADEP
jgi:hypothetical protein